MVFIRNRQRKTPINTQQLSDQVKVMLEKAGFAGFGVSILLTTNKSIRKFNKLFRGKDKPTDVLSFPFHKKIKPGRLPDKQNEDACYLGDIIISIEFALKDAPKTWARPFREHLLVLIHY